MFGQVTLTDNKPVKFWYHRFLALDIAFRE